jgi:hypothetical protein
VTLDGVRTCLTPLDVTRAASAVLGGGGTGGGTGGGPGAGDDEAGVLRRLHAALGTMPGEEHRWLARPEVRSVPELRRALSDAFRPAHPHSWMSNLRAWLSTCDIEAVMRQYEAAFPRFLFLGALPRDFAGRDARGGCVSPPMCSFDLRGLARRGKDCFGAVVNMDPHTRGGSHWVALFCGLDPAQIYRYGVFYYDSTGRPPPSEVAAFMRQVQAQAQAQARDQFTVGVNRVRRQYRNTECGLFAMHFVISCLTTRRSYAQICERMGGDDQINLLRRVLFRRPNGSVPDPEELTPCARLLLREQGGGTALTRVKPVGPPPHTGRHGSREDAGPLPRRTPHLLRRGRTVGPPPHTGRHGSTDDAGPLPRRTPHLLRRGTFMAR